MDDGLLLDRGTTQSVSGTHKVDLADTQRYQDIETLSLASLGHHRVNPSYPDPWIER